MTKQILNEAERYLLERWADARLLEESMEAVRNKYGQLFNKIVEAVGETHPELDGHGFSLTQTWTDGQIGFGKRSWPDGESNEPSGLWVDNLKLEILAVPDAASPIAYLWVPKKANLNFDAARKALMTAASRLLSGEDLKKTLAPGSGGYLLYLPAPSKSELLEALTDGDGASFVKLLAAQFDMMARFVPVLDKLFKECLNSE